MHEINTRTRLKSQGSKMPGPLAVLCWPPKKNGMTMHPETLVCMSTKSLKRTFAFWWPVCTFACCIVEWAVAIKNLGQKGLLWFIFKSLEIASVCWSRGRFEESHPKEQGGDLVGAHIQEPAGTSLGGRLQTIVTETMTACTFG